MSNYVTITSDKKKGTALLLCILFGYVGAHYYYVGRIGRGLLATFTFNFAMIGWIVDIFTIAMGKFRDNVGNPLRE